MFYLFFKLLLLTNIVLASEQQDIQMACEPFLSQVEPEHQSKPSTNIKYKTGLLWEIETPNGKTNYLFGTMHSQDYAVSKYPPPVRLALVKSKVLLMETVPDERASQSFINNIYFKDNEKLNEILETPFYEELKLRIKGYGVEQEQVSKLKPWAAFSLIGRPRPVRAPTLEYNLMKTAEQFQLEIKSLETMDEILSALDELSMEDQLVILKDTICNHDKIISDTKQLVDLYVARDLQGIVDFNKQPHYDEGVFKRFMENILYKRNIKMLKRIESAYETGGVFVAVGASHLAEEKGLLNQLSKKNYKITQIY
ncbi:MAG: TraB/GumN family protein [Gammaproteobacteria bacterium]|jgi:uncharacterized protein YbaP (TraB family)